MEDVFGTIAVIIGIVAAIVGAFQKKAQQAKANTFKPVHSAPAHPQAAPRPAQPAAMPSYQPAALAQPLVHPHLQPDCETHDAPGSLGTVSAEGKDPCHEQLLTHPRTAPEQTASQPGLELEWSGDALVKAFVMQEVLTRPCQRKAR